MNSELDSTKKGIMAMLCSLGYQFILRDRDDNLWAYRMGSRPTAGATGELNDCVSLNWARPVFADIEKDRVLNIFFWAGDMIWAMVPVNTPVFVRHNDKEPWVSRHFYRYNPQSDKPFECYWQGKSQFTIRGEPREWHITGWEQIKLPFSDTPKGGS